VVDDARALSAELRRRLAAGELDSAVELLYGRHEGDVRRFVRSRRPAAPPEDVCQEVWLAAQRALPAFKFDATPLAWLFSIASHKVVDAHRRNQHRDKDVELDSRELLIAHHASGRRPATSAATRVDRQRRIAAVERILDGWDPADRELFELRFLSELKPSEIVDVKGLDVPANTISQRLVRLVQGLRHQLAADSVAGPGPVPADGPALGVDGARSLPVGFPGAAPARARERP